MKKGGMSILEIDRGISYRISWALIICASQSVILPTPGNENACVETNLLSLSPVCYSDPVNQPLDPCGHHDYCRDWQMIQVGPTQGTPCII